MFSMSVEMQTFSTFLFVGLLSYGAFGLAIDSSSDGPSHELNVSELKELLSTEEGIESLYAEYQSIEGGQRMPWTLSSSPENLPKNRYDDLLAFDHSRVVLNKLADDPNSDLINANYIDGVNSEKEYVATQGPLPNTINDFWRMIWQLNATKIVMLANIIEHGKTKVEKYWPDTKATYGDIEVTRLHEFNISNLQHVVRTFSVLKSGFATPRIVRQFHFTGWPDMGVPKNRLQVLSLMREVRKYRPNDRAPIVVHCSAGIGRTGTVLLMDSMVQRGLKEHIVDFPKRLDHMRQLRPDVVEKKEQYLFAYQAVNDLFNVPETQKLLQEVDEEYHHFNDIIELSHPKDVIEGLKKMDWQNTVMRMLIDSLREKIGDDETTSTNEIRNII